MAKKTTRIEIFLSSFTINIIKKALFKQLLNVSKAEKLVVDLITFVLVIKASIKAIFL